MAVIKLKKTSPLLLLTFLLSILFSSFMLNAQELDSTKKARILIERARNLYKDNQFKEALKELFSSMELAEDKKIKSLAAVEIAYVNYLMERDPDIYKVYIWESLGLNPSLQLEDRYEEEFKKAFNEVKLSLTKEPVHLPPPEIELDKKSLLFELIKDKISPSSQVFRIRNAVEGKLDYKISSDTYWINVSPEWGSSAGEWQPITVPVNASELLKLPKGEYKGILTVTSDYSTNSPQEIRVNIKIKPAIELDKTNIYFKLIKGKKEQASQVFMVRNPMGGKLDYKISSDTYWINVSPEWGSSTRNRDSIELRVDSSALEEGEYRGTITIQSDYAINSPQKVNVNLKVVKPYSRPIQFTLGFYGGYYLPKDKIFKQIYGKESLLGGMEISFPLFLRVFDVWINSNYITTNGKSTHTEESSKLTIIPFSLGIRLLVNLKFLIPFLGAGMNYYIYSEEYAEDIYESTRGSSFGSHIQGGIYLKLAKSFLIKLSIKYNDVNTKDNKINLGGIEYATGIVFNF